MKTRNLFLIFILLTFVAFNAQAQEDYTWDDYGLKFSVPTGFKVTQNSSDKFEGEAVRAKITLFGLYPIADENVTEETTMQAVEAMAKEAGMNIRTIDKGAIEFNGFKGSYAEGKIEGISTFFAVMLDESSDLNFIVTVLHDNTDAAIKLIKSIKKMK